MYDSAVWTAALRSSSVLNFIFSVRTEFEMSPGIIYPGVSDAAGTSRGQTQNLMSYLHMPLTVLATAHHMSIFLA